jgi:hypothetical protein
MWRAHTDETMLSFLQQADAQVEITAKVFHGYNAGEAYKGIDEAELKKTKGREYDYDGKEGENGSAK